MRLWSLALLSMGCGGSKSDPASDTGGSPACEEAVFYADVDADGFGDPFSPTRSCEPPEAHVDNREDCDDLDADQHPGMV